jgi:hypothetical protein
MHTLQRVHREVNSRAREFLRRRMRAAADLGLILPLRLLLFLLLMLLVARLARPVALHALPPRCTGCNVCIVRGTHVHVSSCAKADPHTPQAPQW